MKLIGRVKEDGDVKHKPVGFVVVLLMRNFLHLTIFISLVILLLEIVWYNFVKRTFRKKARKKNVAPVFTKRSVRFKCTDFFDSFA